MIRNIWNTIEVYCDNRHEIPIPMQIQEGVSLFYACPKYHNANRDDHEYACSNRINLIEYESMVLYISDIIMENEMNNCSANLNNYEWSNKKGITFKIFEHTKDKIKVIVRNTPAINGAHK